MRRLQIGKMITRFEAEFNTERTEYENVFLFRHPEEPKSLSRACRKNQSLWLELMIILNYAMLEPVLSEVEWILRKNTQNDYSRNFCVQIESTVQHARAWATTLASFQM